MANGAESHDTDCWEGESRSLDREPGRRTGRIVELTEIAGRKAIVPQITGRAWITGEHSYYLDPTDPYPQGYVLSDTWGTSTSVTQ